MKLPKMRFKPLGIVLGVFVFTLVFSVALQSLLADWTAPTSEAPGDNVARPIDTSVFGQLKQGGLVLNTVGLLNGLIVKLGNTGLGTDDPKVKLDVNGEVRIGSTSIACDMDRGGSIRFDNNDNKLYYCDSANWISLIADTPYGNYFDMNNEPEYIQEDVKNSCTKFMVDTANVSGHFVSASGVSQTVGVGGNCPKIVAGTRFKINGVWHNITGISGNGSANNAVSFDGTLPVTSSFSKIDKTAGTIFGNLTMMKGNIAYFDGVLNNEYYDANGGYESTPFNLYGQYGYVGKDWGVNNPRIINRFIAYSSTHGFDMASQGATITMKLQGSNDGATWADLYTTSFPDQWAYFIIDISSGINISTAYRYHKIAWDGTFDSGGQQSTGSEIEFFESGAYDVEAVYATMFTGGVVKLNNPSSSNPKVISQSFGSTFLTNSDGAWTGDTSVYDANTSSGIRAYAADHCIVSGKDWGVGVSKTVTAVKVQGHPAGGFASSGYNPGDMYVYLFGSDTKPTFTANSAGKGQGTVLMSYGPFTDTGGDVGVYITTGIDTGRAYRYHWVGVWTASFPYDMYISEANFYEKDSAMPINNNFTTVTSVSLNSNDWKGIQSAIATENLNSATNNYSVSFDARNSFKVFTGGVWRIIASNKATDHGGTSGDWYYRNNAGTWVTSSVNNANSAISFAVASGANNQMTKTAMSSIASTNWGITGGFSTTQTTFDIGVTQYSNNTNYNPEIDQIAITVK